MCLSRETLLFGYFMGPALFSIQVWMCQLTKKKFNSQKTYDAHIRSKKYRDLLKKKGLDVPPDPLVSAKVQHHQQQNVMQGTNNRLSSPGYNTKSAVPSLQHAQGSFNTQEMEWKGSSQDGDGSSWATASDEETDVVADLRDDDVEGWDPRRSFFDNYMSVSLEANLEYMYKNFGFYLPDIEFLEDPEGLISYLGLKLSVGRVALYTAGDDSNAKQFQSLHAVQRHMIDTNQCRMVYDNNEEEYEEFYNYEGQGVSVGQELALSIGDVSQSAAGNFELVLPGEGSAAPKVLGSREFAKYYRQKPKPLDSRKSVETGRLVAQYRRFGIETAPAVSEMSEKRAQEKFHQFKRKHEQITFMRENVNRNLPRNVPY